MERQWKDKERRSSDLSGPPCARALGVLLDDGGRPPAPRRVGVVRRQPRRAVRSRLIKPRSEVIRAIMMEDSPCLLRGI